MSRAEQRRSARERAGPSLAESEARMRIMLEALPHGVVLQDRTGRLLHANAAARQLLRLPADDASAIPGQRGPGAPGDRGAILLADDSAPILALRTGTPQCRIPIDEPGEPGPLGLTAIPVVDDSGASQAVVSTLLDLTQIAAAETAAAENPPTAPDTSASEVALREAEELFRVTMEHTPVGFAIVALNGRFLRVNRVLCRQFGFRADEMRSRTVYDLMHPEDLEESSTAIRLLLAGEREAITLERRYVGNDGMIVWGQLCLAMVRDHDGVPTHLLAQLQDVSEARKAHDLVTHLTLHDPLTGLANRTLVLDRIQKALDRSRRTDRRVAVLVCDLDHFKIVNDSMGHAAGDALLVGISRRICGALRAADTAGRLGGDEFVVVCEDVVDEKEAILVAERLQQVVAEPIAVGNRSIVPRMSVGIALSSSPDADPLMLLRDADTATYRAKDQGRDRWDLGDVTLRRQALERLDVESALRAGIDGGQMRLHFQPIVDVDTRRVVGREALVRWQHPERGLLGPTEFLQVAEESGLITNLGRWVVREAARVAASSRDRQGYVAVNVSPHQVSRPGLADTVEEALDSSGLPADRLALELTESVMLSSSPAARQEIARLDALGARIVVDDFGTGFSALSYLRDLPVSGIKVDRSFTAGLGRNSQCDRIVEALTGLGRGLGVDVVVEGVETEAQREVLAGIGCEHAQGYLFGRPGPAYDEPVFQ